MKNASNISCEAVVLRNNIEIGYLETISCRVKYNSKANVKRACQLKCSTDAILQKSKKLSQKLVYPSDKLFPSDSLFLVSSEYTNEQLFLDRIKDRIKIYLIKNGVREPLGVYMIISSPITIDSRHSTYDFELYDETMILEQNKIGERLFIAKGTPYLTAINNLIVEKNFKLIVSDDNNDVLSNDREWELGTTLINIINTLLHEINFNDIHVDSNGYVKLIKKESKLSPKFIYKEGHMSILEPTLVSKLDIYKLPNVFVGIVSNPDVPEMKYKIVNDRLDSVISTVNRGYEVVEVYQPDSIASQAELEWYVKNMFNNSLRQTETLKISTGLESGHEFEESIQVSTNEIDGLYKEVAFEMNVSYDGNMTHELEREVFI